MFLIDDLLMLPIKGFLNVFKEIQKKVEEEGKDTPEKLKKELLELQRSLEAGRINEATYSKKERNILERLNALRKETE